MKCAKLSGIQKNHTLIINSKTDNIYGLFTFLINFLGIKKCRIKLIELNFEFSIFFIHFEENSLI